MVKTTHQKVRALIRECSKQTACRECGKLGVEFWHPADGYLCAESDDWEKEIKHKLARCTPLCPEHLKALRERMRVVIGRAYLTVRSYAEALIRMVHYHDQDGREIGFDFGFIRDAILCKFPIITRAGSHQGEPTRMRYHGGGGLWDIAWQLNRSGARLPFRPRRRNTKKV